MTPVTTACPEAGKRKCAKKIYIYIYRHVLVPYKEGGKGSRKNVECALRGCWRQADDFIKWKSCTNVHRLIYVIIIKIHSSAL